MMWWDDKLVEAVERLGLEPDNAIWTILEYGYMR
jgi:hypothetical protein